MLMSTAHRQSNQVTLRCGEYLKFIRNTKNSAYLLAQVLQQKDTTDVLNQALDQYLPPTSKQSQMDPLLCPKAYM